jgi:hypothetical protein
MGVIGEQTSVRIAMISPAILLLAIAGIFLRMESGHADTRSDAELASV